MRTLKKTLCLVLVLAMMVGLCAVGASAAKLDDYSDKDSIQNKEAVAILSALKVLEGDERGFRPADTLTRAEGAAIMTRLLAATGAGVSSFTDMASAAWAQPYVAYCEANGIINGMGDGTFQPQATLTVAQFAKMMLCALGYDAKIEGLTGNAWEINTVKLINKIDLAAGLTNLDYNAAITRDAAAQMAYNTLKATMVEYDGGLNVTTPDGTKVEVGVNSTPVINTSYSYQNNVGTWDGRTGTKDYTMQFCENYFPNLKMTPNVEDDFKMPNNVWWMGNSRKDTNKTNEKVIVSELAGSVMKTYDSNMLVTEKALFADTNESTSKADKELTVIENGVDAGTIKASRTDGSKFPILGYAGATVALIDTNKEGDADYGIGDTLIVKYAYLAKVTRVNAATASAERSVNLEIYTANKSTATPPVYTATTTTFNKYVTDQFAMGDYVLVYPKAAKNAAFTELLDVVAADSIHGNLSKLGLGGGAVTNMTLDGVVYSAAAGGLGNLGPSGTVQQNTGYSINTGYTAYLSNGYVMGVVGDSVAFADYVFVVDAMKVPAQLLTKDSYSVAYVKTDGTLVKTTAYVKDPVKAPVDDLDKVINGWYTVVDMGDGTTAFYPAADKYTVSGDATKLKRDTPTVATGVTADAKTTFIIRSATSTFKTYEGIANVPEYKAFNGGKSTAYGLVAVKGVSNAALIYIDAIGGTSDSAKAAPVFVYTGSADSTTMDGTTAIFTYKAIVNGANSTIDSTLKTADAGLYVPTMNTKGYVTALSDKADDLGALYKMINNTTAHKLTYANGTLKIDGAAYAIAADAEVFIYDTTTRSMTVGTAADLNGYTTSNLSYAQVSSTNSTINKVYAIAAPTAA